MDVIESEARDLSLKKLFDVSQYKYCYVFPKYTEKIKICFSCPIQMVVDSQQVFTNLPSAVWEIREGHVDIILSESFSGC